MAGDTIVETTINAMLTKAYIGSKDLPDDECLSEARHIINMYHEGTQRGVPAYLVEQFGIGKPGDRKYAIELTDFIDKMMREFKTMKIERL